MKPRVHEEEQENEERDEESAPEVPPVAYRVAGDVQVRAAELEQQVDEMKRDMLAMEREVYAARKTLRARAAVRATSIGGLGAFAGALVGSVAYDFVDEPRIILAATFLGFVFGFLGSTPWKSPDDKFPDAPPPRMGY